MKAIILNLKPTQYAVGMDEVEHRIKEMRKMTPKALHEYLHVRKAPVVRGPDSLYMVDRHHLARALWEMGHKHIPIEVMADLRKSKNFWTEMIYHNWAYLADQFGRWHPIPHDLPKNVRCLGDNPWRSLAWKVRMKGGFNKTTEPFAEFQWAELFRKYQAHDIKRALMLCQSPMAKKLPGYKYGK
jgi:hypothetical protein